MKSPLILVSCCFSCVYRDIRRCHAAPGRRPPSTSGHSSPCPPSPAARVRLPFEYFPVGVTDNPLGFPAAHPASVPVFITLAQFPFQILLTPAVILVIRGSGFRTVLKRYRVSVARSEASIDERFNDEGCRAAQLSDFLADHQLLSFIFKHSFKSIRVLFYFFMVISNGLLKKLWVHVLSRFGRIQLHIRTVIHGSHCFLIG